MTDCFVIRSDRGTVTVASGVLSRDVNVYFAIIPNLWLLQDKNQDAVADER